MRRSMMAVVVLLAVTVAAQEASEYAPAENPFQDEFDFAVGAPVPLQVDIEGMRLDSITLSAQRDITPEDSIPCEVFISGSNAAERRGRVLAVMLLEDADSQSLERISLDRFRVRPGRDFREQQTVEVSGAALAQAAKVYLFFEVTF